MQKVIGFIEPINKRQFYILDAEQNYIYKFSAKLALPTLACVPFRRPVNQAERRIQKIRKVDLEKKKEARVVVGRVNSNTNHEKSLQFDHLMDPEVNIRVLAICAEICMQIENAD